MENPSAVALQLDQIRLLAAGLSEDVDPKNAAHIASIRTTLMELLSKFGPVLINILIELLNNGAPIPADS